MAVVDSTMPELTKAGLEKKVRSVKKHANKDLQKTKLCVYNLEGKCGLGSSCCFAHSASEIKDAPDLRKTQLCAKFAEGKCTNTNCSYAHGDFELREPPNFRKKVCKWFLQGKCRNGITCRFAHDLTELRTDLAMPPGILIKQLAPPPGLTKMSLDECDASTDVPSQAESEHDSIGVPVIPEEHLFRFMAGRGSAPLKQQVSLMNAAVGGLQAKLASLEDMMLQSQIAQMQQQIKQLSEQCSSLENGLLTAQPSFSLKSPLNAKAVPFKPSGVSEDSTSVGSD